MIAELPHGYGTLLDRRFKDGAELSGGQWQRIAVARGFYRDAPLLICDEPTAALDARAEHALFERIRERTPTAARSCSSPTGWPASATPTASTSSTTARSSSRATHDELMALDGLYADLYTLQASAYSTTKGAPTRSESFLSVSSGRCVPRVPGQLGWGWGSPARSQLDGLSARASTSR